MKAKYNFKLHDLTIGEIIETTSWANMINHLKERALMGSTIRLEYEELESNEKERRNEK